jgi:hemerythrin superfamily protein
VTISRYLEDDHRRIEQFLQRATPERYAEFRRALLRHIGMEEKILFPAIRSTAGGNSVPGLEQLHLDHGALAAMLVPTPTAAIVNAIRSILDRHNQIEEGPTGIYRQFEKFSTPDEAARVLAKLQSTPAVTVNPHVDNSIAADSMHAAITRAGYSFNF